MAKHEFGIMPYTPQAGKMAKPVFPSTATVSVSNETTATVKLYMPH